MLAQLTVERVTITNGEGPQMSKELEIEVNIAREKKAMPGFNTDKQQTLASMDKFEKIASDQKAKVIIQHEPADVAKLPAFPKAAE